VSGVGLGTPYDEARTRKVNAEAEIAELELAKVRGQLVLAEDVVKAWMDVLGNLKSKLTNIPSKAAPIVASESEAGMVQHILTDLINEALEELASYDPKVSATRISKSEAASEGSDDGAATSAQPKRGRVGRPKKTARLTD
jgi:phage terminase Nu1 subunit (DNA packaging protein)